LTALAESPALENSRNIYLKIEQKQIKKPVNTKALRGNTHRKVLLDEASDIFFHILSTEIQ
jgi:hypothetical protein